MKFQFFNLYNFIQVNLNRIFSVSHGVCVCEGAKTKRNTRIGQREKKAPLITRQTVINVRLYGSPVADGLSAVQL